MMMAPPLARERNLDSIKDDGQVNAEQKRDTGHDDDTSSSKGPVVYQRKKKKLDSIKDDGQVNVEQKRDTDHDDDTSSSKGLVEA
ncbi:hypothetical protein Tco_0878980 [Tanacetum coccineum]